MANSKKTSIIAVLIVAILVVSAIIIVAGTESTPVNTTSTVTDAMNRSINITKAPQRIVSVAPSITEMVYAMGLQDRVVGVTNYCDYPLDSQNRTPAQVHTRIGGYYSPSVEKIKNCTPDLVLILAGVPYNHDGAKFLSQLEALNLTVIVLYDTADISQVYTNLHIVGKATFTESKANQLISSMRNHLQTIQSTIGSGDSATIKVAYVVSLDPIFVAGGNNYIDAIINLSNGHNVFGNLIPWAQPSKETVLVSDVDVLIISGGGPMSGEEIIGFMESDPVWSSLPAVQNHMVYVVTHNAKSAFERAGVRMLDAVGMLAEILHPEDFSKSMPHIIGDDYADYLTTTNPTSSSAGITHIEAGADLVDSVIGW